MWTIVEQNKYTPLHRAAQYRHSESVQLLLTADSNPNVQDIVSAAPSPNVMELYCAELCGEFVQEKCTPLKLAQRQGKSNCVKLLKPVTDSRCTIQ